MNDLMYYIGLVIIGFCSGIGGSTGSYFVGRMLAKKPTKQELIDAVIEELKKKQLIASN